MGALVERLLKTAGGLRIGGGGGGERPEWLEGAIMWTEGNGRGRKESDRGKGGTHTPGPNRPSDVPPIPPITARHDQEDGIQHGCDGLDASEWAGEGVRY